MTKGLKLTGEEYVAISVDVQTEESWLMQFHTGLFVVKIFYKEKFVMTGTSFCTKISNHTLSKDTCGKKYLVRVTQTQKYIYAQTASQRKYKLRNANSNSLGTSSKITQTDYPISFCWASLTRRLFGG